MKRRDFLSWMGAAACGAALPRAGAAEMKRPNIVLCMADDQGWGDMAYNGHPVLKTPHFDAAAAEGLRFDRFYAAAPVCSPTRGSVMTGRHPNRFGCFTWGYPLRPQEVTLPEALKTAGYVTGHFGKWHLGAVEKGSPVNPGASGFDEWLSAPNFFDNDPILSREGFAEPQHGESSMVTADAAIEFLNNYKNGTQPIFCVVWFGSPHKPHESDPEFAAAYDSEEKSLREFYGEIAGMDAAFGKLRAAVKALGDDTIFWYCSDNGGLPEVGSTGGRGHKADIYEGGLRVPAILEWPRMIEAPRVTNMPCNTTDIYPTLLAAAGATVDMQPILDGISLLPLINGTMDTRPKGMGFWRYPAKGIGTPSKEMMAELLAAQAKGKDVAHPDLLFTDANDISKTYPSDTFPGHAAWLAWPWKLHRIEEPENAPVLELYNLADDPMEAIDKKSDETDRVETMKKELESWLVSVVSSLNGVDYPV